MKAKKIVWIIAAVLGGELALILLTTVAQEVLFSGIRFNSSPMSEIILGGIATVVAAILAGVIARLIMKEYHRVVPVAISIIIAAETTYLTIINQSGDPAWFDIIGGLSLIAGIWLGYNYPKVIFTFFGKANRSSNVA